MGLDEELKILSSEDGIANPDQRTGGEKDLANRHSQLDWES